MLLRCLTTARPSTVLTMPFGGCRYHESIADAGSEQATVDLALRAHRNKYPARVKEIALLRSGHFPNAGC